MKKEERKQKVSPLAIIAFGLVIIAITTFAVLRGKEKAPAPLETTAQNNTPAEQKTAEQKAPATSTENQSADFRMPPYYTNTDNVMLDPIKDPSTVSPAAQDSYVVAQNKPKLLAQLPCFCYCDRFGHGSLHDCFVTDHAEMCDICMKEALQADQMDREGITAAEIRETIVAQYHPRDHNNE